MPELRSGGAGENACGAVGRSLTPVAGKSGTGGARLASGGSGLGLAVQV